VGGRRGRMGFKNGILEGVESGKLVGMALQKAGQFESIAVLALGVGTHAKESGDLARVVVEPVGAEIRQGEILVAERTDPGWIMLFPAAAGLVVERGSLLSHSAIVARELGLPCAVAVPAATTWLQTGDLVEVDGASGRVVRLERAS